MCMDSKELDKCPFCGDNAEFRVRNSGIVVVLCTGCGCESGYCADHEQAKQAWNKRHNTYIGIHNGRI